MMHFCLYLLIRISTDCREIRVFFCHFCGFWYHSCSLSLCLVFCVRRSWEGSVWKWDFSTFLGNINVSRKWHGRVRYLCLLNFCVLKSWIQERCHENSKFFRERVRRTHRWLYTQLVWANSQINFNNIYTGTYGCFAFKITSRFFRCEY